MKQQNKTKGTASVVPEPSTSLNEYHVADAIQRSIQSVRQYRYAGRGGPAWSKHPTTGKIVYDPTDVARFIEDRKVVSK